MPAPRRSRPGQLLALVALALVGLYLGVFLGPSATPALGLDLRGGTEVTLTAHPLNGSKVTATELDQAVAIIRQRADGLGVGGAQVSTQGGTNIVVQLPGANRDAAVKAVSQTALLRFRQALSVGSGIPTVATTTPSASASASATATTHKSAKAKTTAKAKASTSSHGDALSSAVTKKTASPTPTASASATPTARPTAAASATPLPSSTDSAGTGATATNTPLPNSQSATLNATFEQAYADWNCAKNPNPTEGDDVASDYIIGCGEYNGTLAKFLLDRVAVEGQQIKTASAGLDSATGSEWQVNLSFTSSGSKAWQAVTAKAYNVNAGVAQSTACTPPTGCNAVAIVLDGVVQSAPYISTKGGIPGGSAQITGGFTQKSANDLADVLKYGALPLRFTLPTVTSVSATLGSSQLHGGLVAGAIGLGLVVLFCLVYYRGLGLVAVGSLAVSGLLLYAVTTLLGHSSLGYTLSLPGIAGFIVAVGITADSFVVYFERLRDEVREGRRLRSAVDRAWPRARRTIISADFISLLAAVVLYVVSIGDVRGFAFTLGLSTISDLFIVFCFTRPLISVLSRRAAFDRGSAWTGIGRDRTRGRGTTEPAGV